MGKKDIIKKLENQIPHKTKTVCTIRHSDGTLYKQSEYTQGQGLETPDKHIDLILDFVTPDGKIVTADDRVIGHL